MKKTTKGLFSLGQLLSTPGALAALAEAGVGPGELLGRHVSGDWGNLDEEDKVLNDQALTDDTRILSAYILSTGTKVWIVSEADRSATTILLPHEY